MCLFQAFQPRIFHGLAATGWAAAAAVPAVNRIHSYVPTQTVAFWFGGWPEKGPPALSPQWPGPLPLSARRPRRTIRSILFVPHEGSLSAISTVSPRDIARIPQCKTGISDRESLPDCHEHGTLGGVGCQSGSANRKPVVMALRQLRSLRYAVDWVTY